MENTGPDTLLSWMSGEFEDPEKAAVILRELRNKYPYSDFISILLLKSLKASGRATDDELSAVSVSVRDREMLFRHLELEAAEALIPEMHEEEKEAAGKESLLDEFLKKDPRIIPDSEDHSEAVRIAEKSNREDSGIMSETLARIYIMQGNTRKARQVYERLRLKYPEKSTYFAGLIEEIDKGGKSVEKE